SYPPARGYRNTRNRCDIPASFCPFSSKKVSMSMSSSLPAGRRTIALAKLARELQMSPRPLTQDEQTLLSQWMGWGPVADLFNRKASEEWTSLGVELEACLPKDWFESGRAATINSYFTDRFMVDAIWKLVLGLGFKGGKVLEPGCGTGLFLAAAPPDLPIDFIGVEQDFLSAFLSQKRFPQATIMNEGLEKISINDESIDLVVGNIPFGDITLYDPSYKKRDNPKYKFKAVIHNFFMLRSLFALRPGGFLAVLTTRYSLDAGNGVGIRTQFAEQANFLGAFRLPSNAHKASATSVVTDILLFQKRAEDGSIPDRAQHRWIETSPDIVPKNNVNWYFADHPEQIIGTKTTIYNQGLYRADELVVVAPEDVVGTLDQAVERFVEETLAQGTAYIPRSDHSVIPESLVIRRADQKKEGSYHLLDGELFQVVDGDLKTVTYCREQLTYLVRLRDAALALFEAERNFDNTDEDLAPLRYELNRSYDSYVALFGPIHKSTITYSTRQKKKKPVIILQDDSINPSEEEEEPEDSIEEEDGTEERVTRRRPPAINAFAKDPYYCLVLGLATIDDETQQETKAEIFFQRINCRPTRKTQTDDPGEAIALCMDQCGHLDLSILSQLLSLPIEEVPAKLG